MRILLSGATHSDRNFSVGVGLVVILAAVEIFSASFYYISRIRGGGTSVQSIAATIRRSATSVTPTSTGRAVSQTGVTSSPVPSLVDRLLTEATELRDRGDTTNALAPLHEALERDPKNPSVLEEMAKTYESRQLFDRAHETWRKLQELCPSAGAAYELADRRLTPGVPTPAAAGTAGGWVPVEGFLVAASRTKRGGG